MALPSKHLNAETGDLEYPDMSMQINLSIIAIIATPIVVVVVACIALLK